MDGKSHEEGVTISVGKNSLGDLRYEVCRCRVESSSTAKGRRRVIASLLIDGFSALTLLLLLPGQRELCEGRGPDPQDVLIEAELRVMVRKVPIVAEGRG